MSLIYTKASVLSITFIGCFPIFSKILENIIISSLHILIYFCLFRFFCLIIFPAISADALLSLCAVPPSFHVRQYPLGKKSASYWLCMSFLPVHELLWSDALLFFNFHNGALSLFFYWQVYQAFVHRLIRNSIRSCG